MSGHCERCGEQVCVCCVEKRITDQDILAMLLKDNQALADSVVELNFKLAESQARIKVLEDALHCANNDTKLWDGHEGSYHSVLSTTSPTEALDKVVRDAVEKDRSMR